MVVNGKVSVQSLREIPTETLIETAVEKAGPEEREAIRQELRQRPRRKPSGLPCWRCERYHKTWYAMAKCRWRQAEWITGDPPITGLCFALLACCGRGTTITLHPTLDEAQKAKATIDATGCGGRCAGWHKIIALHEDC